MAIAREKQGAGMDVPGLKEEQMSETSRSGPSRFSYRLLVVAVVILFGLVVFEGVLLLRFQQRFEQVMGRMADLRVAEELDLGVNTGLLLLITAEDMDFRPRDLQTLNQQSRRWLDDFANRHALDDPIRQLLQGVLSRYLVDYATQRMRDALGESNEDERKRIYRDYEIRYIRTATGILDPNTGAAFEQELREKWPSWVP